ncbi:MAG: hypothetical protein V4590_00765 [Bacteroidota bacterium]
MKHPIYLYRSENSFHLFEFKSEGPNGCVSKIVEYSETATKNVYNLGFGDYNESTKEVDDFSITNNGDSLKVLATVASTVSAFLEHHPQALIFATGSTKSRTRLYRIGISNNFPAISKDFLILGLNKAGNWEHFVVGADYEAFLLSKNKNIFDI